jgi:hypothetical protein
MPNIRIMNWNIQNLGPIKYQLNDVMAAIAKVVVDNNIDIFVAVEINTTKSNMANTIALALRAALNTYATVSHGLPANSYTTYVLSPNTGLEFYGFFIKNTAVVRPVIITGAPPPTQVGDGGTALAACQFAAQAVPGPFPGGFPLMQTDTPLPGHHHNAHWTATRLPCLGLFEIQGAAAANQYLPIVVCHFAPNNIQAPAQFRVLPGFSLLNLIANPPAGGFNLNITNSAGVAGPKPISMAVITGDFNIDYPDASYNPLTGAAAPAASLGFAAGLPAGPPPPPKTHLLTLDEFAVRRPGGNVLNLRTVCYDNFFIGGGFAAGAGAGRRILNPAVIDIPALVRVRNLKLNQSINHYAELDQKGFSGSDRELYKLAGSDYRKQLTVKEMIMSPIAVLIGARLISDHLPVIIELQLP